MSEYYMSWNKIKEITDASSSGGVFTALAEYVLEKGGVVFGVSKNEKENTLFTTYVTKPYDLDKLRGSKYYQSEVNDAFKIVKGFLKKGSIVLFSGTPCQNAGLLAYLKSNNSITSDDYDRLITVDVLCHGITNKHVIESYIDYIEKKYQKGVREVRFRDKEAGWRQSSRMKITFENNETISKHCKEDLFYLGFNNNLILRPSCYMCDYACGIRGTDFSIGDYWGLEDGVVSKDITYHGVGVTLVNTDKAKNIWASEDIKSKVEYTRISRTNGIRKNGALIRPARAHINRYKFFSNLKVKPFDKNIKDCLKKEIIKNQIKKILRVEAFRKIDYSNVPIQSPIYEIEANLILEDGINQVINNERDNIPVLFPKKELCFGCYACMNICPVGAISMKYDKEGFMYPVIDAGTCVRCRKCVSTCPKRKI